MRKILLCTAISTILLTAACNTVRGVGQDVSSVGRTVERAAD
ncbi:entericidin A/B family lipoprotein [Allosphingosinicella indica]|uniref:Predicted small secreted protein n=1 Tax=Allosphingosinicella indica TaxID=941907 RepID=A0A1X7H4G4_9SPHN|nr:entericidin A/B family lipoprotein [Allosphingosinicella indica]SMF78706.1 Predicted small secreted protein [Allosphingosinicella indica]